MKRFTSYEEIETLCEAMIKDFFRSRRYTRSLCVDIEDFVKEYLGIPIVYETMAEPDPGRVGFLSDGKRPLCVCRDGIRKRVVFPAGTAVIEKYLLSPGKNARKRFTIAHEGAHEVLGRHIPLQADLKTAFYSEFDREMRYATDHLKEMMSINESFANRAAACFLMPEFLVKRVLKRYHDSGRIVLYCGEQGAVLSQEHKLLIQKMADAMGVSYTAFSARLRELDLYEIKPVSEYIHSGLGCGGDGCADGY